MAAAAAATPLPAEASGAVREVCADFMTHLRKPEIKIKAQWRHTHTYTHGVGAIIKRQMLKARQINVKSERTLPKPHMTIFGGLAS